MEEADEWLPARRTLAALTADGRNPADAEAMIASYLRNGHLRACADQIWRSDERFTQNAWKSCPPDSIGGPIPRMYWRYEKAIIEDRAQWRFVADRFLVTTRLRPRRRIMMRGVRFNLHDLQILQPISFGKASTRPKRGRPVETEKRDAAWLALLDAVFDKEHPLGAINFKNDLFLAMEAARARRGTVFGDKISEQVASQAFDRLKLFGAI